VLRFFAWIDQREADWFRTRSEGIRLVKEAFDAAGVEMPEPTLQLVASGEAAAAEQPRPTDARRAREGRADGRGARERSADAHRAPAEPELALDISPDSHLDRAVAKDRAHAAEDLLDAGAPPE
jgi:hypothetical protein